MSEFDLDLFVVGGGSGGVRAARIAAGYGAKVAVAEEYRIGGTCVIRGCVPKKLYVYASRFADDFEDAAGFGWTLPERPTFDWRALVSAKEKEISRLSVAYRTNLARAGVAVYDQRATLAGPNAVRLTDGRVLNARYILIATGAKPSLEPAVPGVELTISSNELFDLPKFPDRLLVIGGGYIAVEFASVFARLGARVTQCLRGENILRGFDGDMRDGVRDALAHAGVAFAFGTLPTRIERAAEGLRVFLSNGETLVVDQALLATGRLPNTKGIGLEQVGVALTPLGAVAVDAHSKSNIDSIYAVGDVTNRVNLTPVAIREGHAFADSMFGGRAEAVIHANIPTAVFTTPELGAVGLSEEEAKRIFDVVDVYIAAFRPMKATLSGRREQTIVKIIADGQTDRILGVHVLGHEAGEMAQLLGVAIRIGAKKSDFDATMAVHPTAAEELVTLRVRTRRHERPIMETGPGAAVGEP